MPDGSKRDYANGEVKTIFTLVALSRVRKSRKILPELLETARFVNATLLSALFVMGILGYALNVDFRMIEGMLS